MAGDVVVVRAAAGVDQEEAVAVGEPVLLRVVAPQLLAVVERPGLDRAVVQAVVADRDVTLQVVADRQEIATPGAGQRRLAEPADDVQRQHVAVLAVGQRVAVEGAAHDGHAHTASSADRPK